MKEIDLKIYQAILTNGLQLTKVPKKIQASNNFKNLLASNVITKKPIGKGHVVVANKIDVLRDFIKVNFPNPELIPEKKSENIAKFRNSKAVCTISEPIFFVRGFNNEKINGEKIDLKYHTEKFGLFAVKNLQIECTKICFVENLECFLKAEVLMGTEYVFLHKYGRIGTSSLKKITTQEVLVFSDYDFTGLNEYLNIKQVFKDAIFYIPSNFDEIFDKYSKLSPEQARMSSKVGNSDIPIVKTIKEKSLRTNRFLEQEILFHL